MRTHTQTIGFRIRLMAKVEKSLVNIRKVCSFFNVSLRSLDMVFKSGNLILKYFCAGGRVYQSAPCFYPHKRC